MEGVARAGGIDFNKTRYGLSKKTKRALFLAFRLRSVILRLLRQEMRPLLYPRATTGRAARLIFR